MLADFYNNIILKKPKFVFLSLIILLTFFGFYSKDFRLDASSDTLLIEGDPDLEDDLENIYRQVKVKFGEGKLNENQDDSYYIDEIKRDLEELDDKEANEYLEELAKSILKLKR